MDQSTIDIKYSDLLQWLEERYLIPKDWPSRLEIIKTKKSEILNDLDSKTEDDMKKIQNMFKVFKQTPVDMIPYNDFNKLYLQLQKTNEAKNKNLFGRYNSPLLYAAYLLDGIYLKNNMHLAENAKIIIQNVSYDIPICTKNISDLKHQIEEHENKRNEKNGQIEKNKEIMNNLFKSNDINLDIENCSSNEISIELIERLTKDNFFDNLCKQIEDKIKGKEEIKKAMDLYEEFYKIILNSSNSSSKNETKSKGNSASSSNTSKKGKKKGKEKKEVNVTQKNEEMNSNSNINFIPRLSKFYSEGDYFISESGENPSDSSNTRLEKLESKANEYKTKYTNTEDINKYGISLVGETIKDTEQKEEKEEKVLNDTCLINNRERNLLIADINEILIFIKQRLKNMSKSDEINLTMYNQELKEFNMKYGTEEFNNAKNYLEEVLSSLNEKKFNFLCNLFDDESNIKDFVETFNEMKIKNSKLKNLIEDLKKKDMELSGEIKENEKKLKEFQKTAVQLRKVTENFLTKQLKRKINIMGDINLISK